MELQVYQLDGNTTGRTVELDADVFGIEPNDHVLWLDVRRIQAHSRQGTNQTKERGEVAGSTRKLYRQKGTGMSRAGSAKSPLRRSGGRTFGPRSRTYQLKINKKTRRLARRSALSYKATGEALRVVDSLVFETPNTRRLVEAVEALGLTGRKVLLLTAKHEGALHRSCGNLNRLRVQQAAAASTLDVLDSHVVIVEEAALGLLTETLGHGHAAE